MSFLKAEWKNLVMANYVVNPELLIPFVPAGTTLDLWQGKCYVSLVGFMFMNTRLLGVKIPGHVHFEEVNLRFYVRHGNDTAYKRGVVFIKEIVPKPALTFVANTVYNENYETMPMEHRWEKKNAYKLVEYRWKKLNSWNHIRVRARQEPKEPGKGSEAEFITEHYWGYAKMNAHKSNEYEVTHPAWKIYPIIEHDIQVDFGKVYGEQFAFLTGLEPDSVMLAKGSEITVESGQKISSANTA